LSSLQERIRSSLQPYLNIWYVWSYMAITEYKSFKKSVKLFLIRINWIVTLRIYLNLCLFIIKSRILCPRPIRSFCFFNSYHFLTNSLNFFLILIVNECILMITTKANCLRHKWSFHLLLSTKFILNCIRFCIIPFWFHWGFNFLFKNLFLFVNFIKFKRN